MRLEGQVGDLDRGGHGTQRRDLAGQGRVGAPVLEGLGARLHGLIVEGRERGTAHGLQGVHGGPIAVDQGRFQSVRLEERANRVR